MRLIIFILFFSSGVTWAAGPSGFKRACSFFLEVFFDHRVPSIAEKDLNFIINNREDEFSRSELLSPFKGMTFSTEKHQYLLEKRIGHSSNDVYFGKSESGKMVAIKTQAAIENMWVYSVMHYEKEVTNFYRAHKLPVAEMMDLHYNQTRPFYAVEYIRGVSLAEMKKYLQFFSEETIKIREMELEETMALFRKTHQGFSDYLQKKNINLKKFSTIDPAYHHALDHLIKVGDIREEQFLYNFAQKRWICIDP